MCKECFDIRGSENIEKNLMKKKILLIVNLANMHGSENSGF